MLTFVGSSGAGCSCCNSPDPSSLWLMEEWLPGLYSEKATGRAVFSRVILALDEAAVRMGFLGAPAWPEGAINSFPATSMIPVTRTDIPAMNHLFFVCK